MYAYCGNNPVSGVDPTGTAWWHWALAAVAVVALVAASVVTCGGALAAAGAATAIATGTCTAVSTGATIVTGAAMGAGVAFAGSVVYAASTSNSLEEFADKGEDALVNTTIGGFTGAAAGYGNSQACCFIAGTLVLASEENKPIERIQVGDYVWAWDENTGDVALKQVVETYINETSELTHIIVDGEEIVCTPTHPFYSPQKGWTDACKLRAGDILVLVNGEYVVVEKVQHELLERPIKVYNFQVEDYHTYYVADGILVHNSCQRGVGGKGWEGDRTWRENVNIVRQGGTITELNGGIPSVEQATRLIQQADGVISRVEAAHAFPNPHTYPHINYIVNGTKGTLKILGIER